MALLWVSPLRILLSVIVVVFVISLLQFLTSIHPPRFTTKLTPDSQGLSYENVSFTTTDNVLIKAWLIPSEQANATIIVGHGYPFDKANILPLVTFLYPSYNLLLYDHRYFGESDGRITTAGAREVHDVEAAVGWVRKKYGKQHPVGLYGFSLSASAMLMAQPDVRAIVAEAPYASLDNMVRVVYRIFGPFRFPFVATTRLYSRIFLGVDPKDVSPREAVKDSHIPTLMIHGDKDSQIPVENAHQIKEANPGIELWIVEGADHGEAHSLRGDEYERRVRAFFKEHLTNKE